MAQQATLSEGGSEEQTTTETVTVTYIRSKHAPLFERYYSDGGYEKVGEKGEYGRVDPTTDGEYRVLVGDDNSHSKDYKVGSVYPHSTFIHGKDAEGHSLDHETLERTLREINQWTDALKPVVLPKGYEYGEVTWWYGFQFSPVERAPKLDRVENQLERAVGEGLVFALGKNVEAPVDLE